MLSTRHPKFGKELITFRTYKSVLYEGGNFPGEIQQISFGYQKPHNCRHPADNFTRYF